MPFVTDDVRVAVILLVLLVTGIDLGIAFLMRAGHEAGTERDL